MRWAGNVFKREQKTLVKEIKEGMPDCGDHQEGQGKDGGTVQGRTPTKWELP